MALGTASMSPIELATAYTAFATLGTAVRPRFVTRVEDTDGRTLWRTDVTRAPALDPGVAYIVTDILRDAIDYGTGTAVRAAGFRGPAAGKTGTTSDATDAWFVGYTPELVGTIWMGYDTPSPISSAATGGGFAAPVWGRIMRRVYANREMPPAWVPPASVVSMIIDPESGLPLGDGCSPRYGSSASELFLVDRIPEAICPEPLRWYDRIWGAIGGVFGEDDRREIDRARRRMQRDIERARRRGRGNHEDDPAEEIREREEELREFLEERAEQIREQRRRRGN
jgi:penicillin-binding protein 1A